MNGSTIWWQSKGVWGGIIAVLAGAATLAGVKLDATLQDQLATLLTGAGEVIGGALAWYGRVQASTVISSSLVK